MDLKDLSEIGKLNELIGLFQVLKEQDVIINISQEYLITLLKSLKICQIKEEKRKIKENYKEIQGVDTTSVFFQMYGKYLNVDGVKSVFLNLIPLLQERSLQIQVLYLLKNLVKGNFNSITRAKR